MAPKGTLRIYLLIVLFGLLFYVPFTGKVHLFDWDEINFAESAREMIVTGNYLDVQINFETFWEKPPLFIWMQVISMKMFGINEFAARFPNAICGILTLIVLYRTGKRIRDEKFSFLWAMSYTASILPFFYFKSGIIDPWFNLFIFLGMIRFIFYLSENNSRRSNLLLSAFFTGLAILTKGPVALLILILSFAVYLIIAKFRIRTSVWDVILFTLVLAFTGGFWFILQAANGNSDVIADFIAYQVRLFSTRDAGHGGFLFYHFVVLLFGVFPASFFALQGFRRDHDTDGTPAVFHSWMLIVFWVVLILFTIVKTKIVHYSSLCYFPLTYFSAVFLSRMTTRGKTLHPVSAALLMITGILFGLLISFMPLVEKFKPWLTSPGLIKDPFARGNLEAEVSWNLIVPLTGILFVIAVIYFSLRIRKGINPAITGIFASTVMFSYLTMLFVTPKIEAYSQRAAIEFYKSVSGEDAYVTTLGFKSYAPLFYGNVVPENSTSEKEHLLKGKPGKPLYIVMKTGKTGRYMREYPGIVILYEKNGFVFTKKMTND